MNLKIRQDLTATADAQCWKFESWHVKSLFGGNDGSSAETLS